MADYNSVLRKAVAGLQENTGSARRAVYQRARNAIVKQLKSYDPPLSPSQITEEQLKLEEAIRKVEAEAARESLGLGRPKTTPAPNPQQPAPTNPDSPAAPSPSQDKSKAADPKAKAPAREEPKAPASKSDVFKEAVRAAQDLGNAAHQANQIARDQLPEASNARKEPDLGSMDESEERKAAESLPTKGAVKTSAEERSWVPGEARRSKLETRAKTRPEIDEPAKVQPKASKKPSSSRKPVVAQRVGDAIEQEEGLKPSNARRFVSMLIVAAIILAVAAGVYSQRGTILSLILPVETSETGGANGASTNGDEPLRVEPERAPKKNTDRLLPSDEGAKVSPEATRVTTTRITRNSSSATATDSTATAPVLRTVDTPSAPAENSGSAQVLPEKEPAQEVAAVETSSVPPAESAGTETAISPVAQQSILYEEASTPGTAGSASRGNVIWSLDDENGIPVIKAVATLPSRDFSVEMKLKPNNDKSLPASHLLELSFMLPEGFDGKGVEKVPGLILKKTESEAGEPLDGAAVKVSDTLFWIALSDSEADKAKNLQRLTEREWIDVPLLYLNGRRAMLTFEKGTTGNQVVAQAIQSWK
ncbi:hypothetical protein PsAD2_01353 [Pseudovibrio axinellae]|uniref:Uncharacterized protein n=1 Tax=Pseudovibrio axinellae TaxID=989403 RepID=A0A166ACA8_9HYPH|nr:hypothetical protein [Pseudovibrio axinellae]KZL20862.1 hypothetical protein PsAD2_01353 [Pseudovibrio axinellae]SER20407.1 hypothetical protein SAMN05421798_10723 [Pseudovibrio axinellae]